MGKENKNKAFDSFLDKHGNIVMCSSYWDFMGELKIKHCTIDKKRAVEILKNITQTIVEFDDAILILLILYYV